ncbi:MAG: hypothetical protein RIR96_685 [Bacteroidota bacterium]
MKSGYLGLPIILIMKRLQARSLRNRFTDISELEQQLEQLYLQL